MKHKLYILLGLVVVILAYLMLIGVNGYRLALGYNTGNSAYVCLPIIVEKQAIAVEHLDRAPRPENHYLPTHPNYANNACHLLGVE